MLRILLIAFLFCIGCATSNTKPALLTYEDFKKIALESQPSPSIFTEKTKSEKPTTVQGKNFTHFEWNGMANPSIELLTNEQGLIVEKVFIPSFHSFESVLSNLLDGPFKGMKFAKIPIQCSKGQEFILADKKTGNYLVVDGKNVAAIGISTPELMKLRLADNSQKCEFSK